MASVAIVGLFGACQSSELPMPDETMHFGSVEAEIMGGYQAFEDTAVVLLTRFGGGGFGLCSGSLIAPNLVLTAQHCIADTLNVQTGQSVDGVNCSNTGFGSPYPAWSMAITTRPYVSQNFNEYHLVKEIVVPDDGQQGFCGRDVALLILETNVPASEAVPLVPRVDEQLMSGESYSAVGYGHTGGGNDSGVRRRRDDLTLSCVGGEDCLFLPYEHEWMGETGVCQGDSGGPAIDEFGRVTGVASRGPALCASPVYGSVYAWGDFIREIALRAAEDAGLEPAPWVMGWPTDPSFSTAWGEDCQNGLVCESGLCLGGKCSRRCSDAAPCPNGYACIEVDPGAAFVDGDYCEPLSVGGACASDDDCDGTCLDGSCTRYCDESLGCPDGYSCDDGLCRLAPIGGPCNETCAGGQCVDGVCSRECSASRPCPNGWSCTDGVCALTPTGAECAADADCVGGRCEGGLCTRYCDASTPCLDGWVCDESAGECVHGAVGEQCDLDTDCSDGTCVDGACTRECSATAPCPGGYQCGAAGQCEPIPVSTQPGSGCSAAPLSMPFRGAEMGWMLVLGLLAVGWRRSRAC